MAKQPGLPEQLSDLGFPMSGLDLTDEFELQRPQTTSISQNVRVYEALTQRGRGGSRPGLAQYVPQQVSGSNLIQHLNYIVDPQASALSANFATLPLIQFPNLPYGFGTILFPNFTEPPLNVFVPNPPATGGNGVQTPGPAATWTIGALFLQSAVDGAFDLPGAAVTLPLSVTAGHGIVVCVNSYVQIGSDVVEGVLASLTDTLGTSYQQIGSYVWHTLDGAPQWTGSMWYGTAPASGPCTVSGLLATGGGLTENWFVLGALEFARPLVADSATANAATTTDGDDTGFVGPISLTDSGQEVVLAFFSPMSDHLVSIGAGWTELVPPSQGTVGVGLEAMGLVQVGGSPTATFTEEPGGGSGYVAIGASFKIG